MSKQLIRLADCTMAFNGEVVLEYLDTEDPIYDQGHFAFYVHKTLGPVYISPVK